MNVKPEDLARIDQIVDDLCLKLQRRTVVESSGIAYETAQSMNEIIRLCRFQYSDAYIKLIRDIGAKLQSAQPIEFTVTNVVRRVLYRLRLAIKEIKKARETAPPQSPASSTTPFLSQSASCLQCKPGEVLSESYDFGSYDVPHMPQPLRGRITDVIAAAAAGGVGGGVTPPSTSPVGAGGQNTSPSVIIQQQQQAGSLTSSLMGNFAKLFYGNSGECGDSSSLKLNKTERVTLRNAVTEFIEKELVPDIKGVSHDIRGSRDSEQVHPSEIIMVYGGSNTVREYLINRSIKLSGQGGEFEVYVAEAAPSYNGHRMAADLAYGGIKTTLIPDTAICAMMSRVNKVIVGVHAIMANGGLVAQAGLHAVALAAKAHSVPLVIVASTFKITPVFPNNKEFLASMDSPAAIFPIDKMSSLGNVEVAVPRFDYVPPELVSLFITNGTFIFQLDQEFKDTRPVISSLEHRHPNVAHYHSTVESTRGNRYVLMEHKEGMMTLRDFIKSRKEPDQKTKNLIFSGIVHGAQYLYEYKIVVKNLCPSTIMIHEHDLVPIIFDFRFARSEDRPFTTRPEKEEYDYYKDCLYDDEWEYLFCMREESFFGGHKKLKGSKKLTDVVKYFDFYSLVPEIGDDDVNLSAQLCIATYKHAVNKVLFTPSFCSYFSGFEYMYENMDVIASIKDKMRRVFRLHGAVLTKSLLFRKQKKVLIGDEVSSPRLPPRKETGVPQPPKDTESFLTSLESSGSSVSSLRSSAYSESMLSSDELSMTSSSSNNINSSRMHLSSHQKGSSTKLRTKRKQQQQQQQQPQPKRKSVTVLAQNGELIKIMNGDPEFTPELDTAGQPLRTYSFTTGLLEVNEHLRPTFIATFCVYETLREYNTSVLATLEAEFFTVLCSCLYRPDEKLVTTLGYLKSTGATTGRVKLSDNLDKLNSEFLKKELKELYKALKEINLFSRFTDFYFLKEADPPPPDGTCSGFVFQVTKNKDVLAEGQCVVSEGVKVRLELHIFLDRLNAEMSCDWDKLSGCHVQLDSPCASSENESSISSSVPKVSDKSDKGRDIICSTYGDPMKKVCIIIESNDENYVGLHIASALWEKMFVVVFVFDNVHIDSPLTSDSSLGWSVVVESDGSIKLMKRQMLKSGKIQRLEKDVDRCLDAITRGSIRGEPSGVDTAPAETKFDVMYVPKISVKAMKAKNSTKARKPKGSSDSYSDDSFSEDESGLCIGTPASSVFVSYSFMDPQTRAQENEAITQYYKDSLGGLANQFSVVLMVMENIDFTKITVSLYLDPGDSMAYEEYGCLFYHLYKIKRNEKNSLVVIVKHNSRCIGCERYNSSLVLLPEDIARVRKKYKFVPSNTTLPKSISLQQFSSAPPPFPSYSKFSLSSLSASSSSSSSISLDSSGSSLSPTDSSRELNSPQGKPPTKVNPNRGKAGSPKKQQNPAKTSKKAKKTKKQK